MSRNHRHQNTTPIPSPKTTRTRQHGTVPNTLTNPSPRWQKSNRPDTRIQSSTTQTVIIHGGSCNDNEEPMQIPNSGKPDTTNTREMTHSIDNPLMHPSPSVFSSLTRPNHTLVSMSLNLGHLSETMTLSTSIHRTSTSSSPSSLCSKSLRGSRPSIKRPTCRTTLGLSTPTCTAADCNAKSTLLISARCTVCNGLSAEQHHLHCSEPPFVIRSQEIKMAQLSKKPSLSRHPRKEPSPNTLKV